MSDITINEKSKWAGGKSPFNLSYGKLMMWIFLASDIFTFSGLLIMYGAIRFKSAAAKVNESIGFGDSVGHDFVEKMQHGGYFSPDTWPSPELVFNHLPFVHNHLPLIFVSIMTFILIASSVTMVLAVDAGHRKDSKDVSKFMLMTIVGGAIFLGCQAWEWSVFIGEGATLAKNPFGHRDFAAFFFLVTGFHGLHVLSGVVLNIIVYINNLGGTYERRGHYEMVEKVGLYWHFVDLVWVFVFTFFYLI